VTLLVSGAGSAAFGQASQSAASAPNLAAGTAAASRSDLEAQREQIWDSPRMLRARAWVKEYLDRSTKYTPEEARQYMTELENLTPIQMKLWLLKFDEEQEALDRQQEAFNVARQAALERARRIAERRRDAYGRVVQGAQLESQRAMRSLRAQDQAAQERQMQMRDMRAEAATESLYDTPYPYSYLYGPWY
jgi:hypothetical protein